MRVTLVHNAGAGGEEEGDAERLVRLLEDAGHEVRLLSSSEPDLARALQAPAELVVVAGGDGTVARAAKAVVGRGLPIAPLPAGTANNIARSLGLVDRPWEELVRAWPEARRVKLDVGVASGPWGRRYFVEGVGAGLFACQLSSDDPRREAVQRGAPEERVALALEMLRDRAARCEAVELRAKLDGKDVSGRYLLFEVLNIRYVGPNLFLGPDRQPGDGSFDLVLATEAERERLESYLGAWQKNRERLSVLPSHRGKHLRIDWTGFDLHLDDELWPEPGGAPPPRPAVIELRTGETAVEFLAPDPRPEG